MVMPYFAGSIANYEFDFVSAVSERATLPVLWYQTVYPPVVFVKKQRKVPQLNFLDFRERATSPVLWYVTLYNKTYLTVHPKKIQ